MSALVRMSESDRFLNMEKVAELKLQGYNDTQVANQLQLKRVQVKELFTDYRNTLAKDTESRDRARDQLNTMVAHYDMLIKKLYQLLDELEQENFGAAIAAQRNSAIKQIGDLEAKRLEAMQKAGILDASELGDELVQMEEQRDMVLQILRNDLCPACRRKVMEKLSAVTNKAEVVVVYDAQ